MTDIEFGVAIVATDSARDFAQLVRRAVDLGYDVLAAPDHLGALSPFTALAAAAPLTERLRLRTYVLNVGFWNPALLAREVATLDLLSGGRAELGLGAGHQKAEHDDAGLPWSPLQQRIGALQQLLLEVRRRLADEEHQPRPVQRPVPILVGAMSASGLAVAARHADIVGFAGLRQLPGAPAGTFTVASAAQTLDRVQQVREQTGGRPYRSEVLLQAVELGDPAASAERIAQGAPGLTAEQLLDSPFVLLASDAGAAADELRRRRERYGFTSVTTHQPYLSALGEVIEAYRASATG